MANPTTKLNPKYTVTLTIDGKKEQFPLQFDLSEAATKKGINLQFVLPDELIKDPRKKQEITNQISVAIQKKFGEAGIPVDFNERSAYTNTASFIIPLSSISSYLMKILKGQ